MVQPLKPKERIDQLAKEIEPEVARESTDWVVSEGKKRGLTEADLVEVLRDKDNELAQAFALEIRKDARRRATEHVLEEMSDWVDTLEERLKKLEGQPSGVGESYTVEVRPSR